MSKCIRHEACPSCRKIGKDKHGDNLGIYEDGSKYCFSCGYTRRGKNTVSKALETAGKVFDEKVALPHMVSLPPDCSPDLPREAIEWLGKYGFNLSHAKREKLLWTEFFRRLIFPIYDTDKNLIAWTGRYMPIGESQGRSLETPWKSAYRKLMTSQETDIKNKPPKWYTSGDIRAIPYIKRNSRYNDILFIVEDIISCLNIYYNTEYDCLCLFGSSIPDTLIYNIKLQGYNKVVLWLDRDKYNEANKYSDNMEYNFNINSRELYTFHDPKDYKADDVRAYTSLEERKF